MAANWVVKTKTPKQTLGIIELSPHKDRKDHEISYQFHPLSWGNGFASEAIRYVLDHALGDLGFERIIAETQTANGRSCRLLEGLGFVEIDRVERFGAQQSIYAIE